MAHKSLPRWMKALAVAAAVVMATGGVASAQHQHCVARGELVATLTENFDEKQIAFGLIGRMAIMELYVGPTGSWTVIVTDTRGRSCIVAAGDNWEGTAVLLGQDA